MLAKPSNLLALPLQLCLKLLYHLLRCVVRILQITKLCFGIFPQLYRFTGLSCRLAGL